MTQVVGGSGSCESAKIETLQPLIGLNCKDWPRDFIFKLYGVVGVSVFEYTKIEIL